MRLWILKSLCGMCVFVMFLIRVATVEAETNNAVAFIGVNERIIMDSRVPALGPVFTVETFFRWDGRTQTQYQAIINRQLYSNQEWGFYLNADNGRVGATINYDGQHAGSQSVWFGESSSSIVKAGDWAHVALVGTGSEFRFYLNGKLVTSKPETAAPLLPAKNTPAVSAGGLNGGATAEPFNGLIDEMRISSAVRYSGTTYTIPTSEFVNDASTVGLWHFNETSGNSATDASGHNYTGKMYALDTVTQARWVVGYPFNSMITHSDWRDYLSLCLGYGTGMANLVNFNTLIKQLFN